MPCSEEEDVRKVLSGTEEGPEAGCVPGMGWEWREQLGIMGWSRIIVRPYLQFLKIVPWKLNCSPGSRPSADLSTAKPSSIHCKEQPLPCGEAGRRGRLNDGVLGRFLTAQARELRSPLGLERCQVDSWEMGKISPPSFQRLKILMVPEI